MSTLISCVFEGTRDSRLNPMNFELPIQATRDYLFRVIRFELDESSLRGSDNGLGAINDLQLAENVLDMNSHGIFSDVECRPDFLVPEALGDEIQNLQFTF